MHSINKSSKISEIPLYICQKSQINSIKMFFDANYAYIRIVYHDSTTYMPARYVGDF